MTAQRLLLLDTASLYFRAFYGVPDSLRTPDGRPVNAVRGLLDFIAHLVTTYRPTHLACCWDNDWRPEWRVELIPSYKAHRVAGGGDTVVPEMATTIPGESAPDALAAQVPMILDVLAALGLPVVGLDHYEADDVIGTLASTAPMATDVVTGDRDLFQLVDDAKPVRVLYIARGVGKHEVVDDAWIQGRYGVPASAYVDYATLRGDASDGLPGVSGIGEKTAASLLTSYGDLHGILEASSRENSPVSGGVRSKLGAAIDYLAVAPTVVAVARDLELGVTWDDLVLPEAPAHPRTFARLTEELGLSGSAARVLASLSRDA
ncbi:5'-3' exonuclease H3TH domain-containing protein [Microlunatus capsulatus]|uniref:5'-3' exonuclease n=1 Tax=Microlunatus capsulatus TaxID=99117 RepID=A0ABS4Z2L6_9ACTN|nr:5'-3' exonuclease [Microlunatus capsulatus]MBP2415284.1 5'-3' exonuclease [Microlunatus capsulatus]